MFTSRESLIVHDAYKDERFNRTVDDVAIADLFVVCPGIIQFTPNLSLGEGWTQETASHRVQLVADMTVFSQMNVIGRQRSAECTTGIPGRGLNPNIVERAVAQDLAIGHAVEGDTPRQAKAVDPRFLCECPGQAQNNFFRYRLDGCGEIHMTLG